MSSSGILSIDDRQLYGVNIRRLMARLDMTLADLVAASGLDERTLRSLIRETTRPHARTLRKLADGLGVDVDELFRNPLDFPVGPLSGGESALDRAAFDRATNPAVARAIRDRPDMFAGWTTAEYEELFSLMAVGGELTDEGALAAARSMNRRREVITRATVVLESVEGDLLRDVIDLLYRRVTVSPETGSPETGSPGHESHETMSPDKVSPDKVSPE
ncbi:MAG: helix-turn-helix transcriptional regulator [Planctomycetota bacterium]